MSNTENIKYIIQLQSSMASGFLSRDGTLTKDRSEARVFDGEKAAMTAFWEYYLEHGNSLELFPPLRATLLEV